MTNTTDTAREQFEIVRRGYEPQQVDRRISALARELQAARQRAVDLERRTEDQQGREADADTPAFAGLGARIEKILGLADEEAQELRSRATAETEQHRALSEQAADKVRAEADRFARERRSEAEAEAARVLEDARRQSDQLRDSTERDAKARREEAEALFEGNRAKAAQAAADFETTLAHRREQAERDFTEQLKANEQQLSVVSHRSEQLRLEAEKLRADADRKSKRTLDESQRQADDLIAEAKAAAERIRTESGRELAAATQRRDSINAQLTNVRQMLATLTGATLPNPLGDDTPDPKPVASGTEQHGESVKNDTNDKNGKNAAAAGAATSPAATTAGDAAPASPPAAPPSHVSTDRPPAKDQPAAKDQPVDTAAPRAKDAPTSSRPDKR